MPVANSNLHRRTHTIRVSFSEYDKPSARGSERLEGFEREAQYRYTDENGRKLFTIVAYRNAAGRKELDTVYPLDLDASYHARKNPEPKPKRRTRRRVLYRLPDVLDAVDTGETVWLCEGEKDAENIAAQGVVATSAPYGANHWAPEYTEQLRGAHVVLVADDDDPGWARVERLCAELDVASLRVVRGLVLGGDASDHLDAGYGLDDFEVVSDG